VGGTPHALQQRGISEKKHMRPKQSPFLELTPMGEGIGLIQGDVRGGWGKVTYGSCQKKILTSYLSEVKKRGIRNLALGEKE